MSAWSIKLPPDLLTDIKAAAEADGFSNHSEWVRVQLRKETRRALASASEPASADAAR